MLELQYLSFTLDSLVQNKYLVLWMKLLRIALKSKPGWCKQVSKIITSEGPTVNLVFNGQTLNNPVRPWEQKLHHQERSNHYTCLLHTGMATASQPPPQTPPSGKHHWTVRSLAPPMFSLWLLGVLWDAAIFLLKKKKNAKKKENLLFGT